MIKIKVGTASDGGTVRVYIYEGLSCLGSAYVDARCSYATFHWLVENFEADRNFARASGILRDKLLDADLPGCREPLYSSDLIAEIHYEG